MFESLKNSLFWTWFKARTAKAVPIRRKKNKMIAFLRFLSDYGVSFSSICCLSLIVKLIKLVLLPEREEPEADPD